MDRSLLSLSLPKQVEAELSDHGRSAEELAKYLIILKREMERHIGEKRKFKEEAKKATEDNFKYENELERIRRENELKQVNIFPFMRLNLVVCNQDIFSRVHATL